jgi:hypothetical protein
MIRMVLLTVVWAAPALAADTTNLDPPGTCYRGRLVASAGDGVGENINIGISGRMTPGKLNELANKWQLAMTLFCDEPQMPSFTLKPTQKQQ